jgi:hypothetical protein
VVRDSNFRKLMFIQRYGKNYITNSFWSYSNFRFTTSYGLYSGAVPNEKLLEKLILIRQKSLLESDATTGLSLIFAYL